MDLTANPFNIASLIKKCNDQKLGLPEFQRDFIWSPVRVADLLRTVARGWPCGTLLLLEGPQKFACKAIESAPPAGPDLDLLILDGQQRITALYQAISESAEEIYYVDYAALRERGELDDDHILFLKSPKYKRKFPNIEAEVGARKIRISTLADDSQFFRWISYLPKDEQDNAVRLRTEQLAGFKHYPIPGVMLPKDVPIAALAKIFETLNRTGVKLDAFDLMVAKLYPFEFKLRDKFRDAIELHEDTFKMYSVEGIEILKLIALREHLRQVEEDVDKKTVKGVREGDVLNLDPETVKTNWDWAVLSYSSALKFIRDNCGVATPSLLSSTSMLLPLAEALDAGAPSRAKFEKDLERWYWASTFMQTYSQGANTQAIADSKDLRAWKKNKASVPRSIATFHFDDDSLLDSRRRNEILVKGLVGALIRNNARDWISNSPLSALSSLNDHHVFAERYLQSIGIKDPHLVVNFTPLSETTNKAIRDNSPQTVIARDDISSAAIQSHLIPLREYESNDWPAFQKERARMLSKFIYELAGTPQPVA